MDCQPLRLYELLFILLFLPLTSTFDPNFLSIKLTRLKAKRFSDDLLDPESQTVVFKRDTGSELGENPEIHAQLAKREDSSPECHQCKILIPISSFWNCPIFIKELQCQPYTIEFTNTGCLTANVTCPEPNLSDKASASYLSAVAYDLINQEHVLHILQYGKDDVMKDSDSFDIENPHPGRGFHAHLLCDDFRRWILFANDRKYDIDSLFCLTVHMNQLDLIRDLFPV
uniref:Uncharacterized protein n=1 Tax=Setaria digitata TaxID=48799 RepID=A0A915PRZ9_9BILA